MTKPKQKRLRTGCQNCKELRLKCDRTKPNCNNCTKKELQCDYNRKLMWINSDKADSRHPSFKNKGKKHAKIANSMLDMTEEYDLLLNNYPDDTTDNQIITQTHQLTSISLSTYQTRLSSIISSLPPEIYNIFHKNQQSVSIFTHYLCKTCPLIDPLNGHGSRNISEKFFVPFAIHNPSSLHGILCLSASQLSRSNPQFKQSALVHKSLSYKHLYATLNNSAESIGINAMAAIFCHLAIEVIDNGANNWKLHINALRNIVRERSRKGLVNDELMMFMYLRISRYDNFASLTTGDCPIFKTFFDIEDFEEFDPLIRNFDGVYGGVPSKILFFCAILSYISRSVYEKNLDEDGLCEFLQKELNTDIETLNKRMEELLRETSSFIQSEEWEQVEIIWKSTLILHFSESIYNKPIKESSTVQNAIDALEKLANQDSFFCANLAFPIMKLSLSVSKCQRSKVLEILNKFYEKTSIGTFRQVIETMDKTWRLIDDGQNISPGDRWKPGDSWDVFFA